MILRLDIDVMDTGMRVKGVMMRIETWLRFIVQECSYTSDAFYFQPMIPLSRFEFTMSVFQFLGTSFQ